MLEEIVTDYSEYFKLDVQNGFQTVQDVVDNMLTRLEELTSVIQMVKLKNSGCSSSVTDDISKYRTEIALLSKKIATINEITLKLISNVDLLEKYVEKAEMDFSVNSDNKFKSLLKPFLKRNKDSAPANNATVMPDKIHFTSVLDSFQEI